MALNVRHVPGARVVERRVDSFDGGRNVLVGDIERVRMDEHRLLDAFRFPQISDDAAGETEHFPGLLEAWVLPEARE